MTPQKKQMIMAVGSIILIAGSLIFDKIEARKQATERAKRIEANRKSHAEFMMKWNALDKIIARQLNSAKFWDIVADFAQ